MRGVIIKVFSVVGLVCFSLLVFSSSNLTFFWLFLELASLCVVPLFFLYSGSDELSGLFNYMIASGISSALILCGVLCSDLMFVLVIGLLLKFGLFPLWGWVYKVSLSSNWIVVWALSTFLKAPVFFLPFLLSSGVCYALINFLCCLGFMLLSYLFWFYSFGWFYCWCHMMLASSASLVAMSFVLGSDVLFFVFFVYLVWGSLVIWYFSSCGSGGLGGGFSCFVFCFLLLSFPVSVALFYKLVMVSGMFSCSLMVLFFWVVYSISEQAYLMKFVMSYDLPKSEYMGLGVV